MVSIVMLTLTATMYALLKDTVCATVATQPNRVIAANCIPPRIPQTHLRNCSLKIIVIYFVEKPNKHQSFHHIKFYVPKQLPPINPSTTWEAK